MLCPQCGAHNEPQADFCHVCGRSISGRPPELWNPYATGLWSYLFTPAFGSYLQMLNWRALGEPKRAASAQKWFYASIAMLGLDVPLLAFGLHTSQLARAMWLLFLLAWYFLSCRQQEQYIKGKFGANYKRRPWGKVLLIALVCLISFCIISAFSWSLIFGHPTLSPEQVFKRVSPSVVIIEFYGHPLQSGVAPLALGSGVVVGPEEVVTNQHVILHYFGYVRVRQGKSIWLAFVKYMDRTNDLCILTVPGLNAPPISLAKSASAKVGERVYAIGAPEGLELTLSEGLVSGLRAAGENQQAGIIQTTAAISHGSSGGGLFDRHGALLGITTAFLSEGQNLNFAIPADKLRYDIETANQPCYNQLAKLLASAQADSSDRWHLLTQCELYCQSVAETWYLSLCLAMPEGRNLYEGTSSNGALATLERVTKLEPRFDDAWYGIARCIENGAEERMIEWRRTSNARQLGLTIESYLHYITPEAREDYEKAKKAMGVALTLRPDDQEYLLAFAENCFALGQRSEAEQALQRLFRLDPHNIPALALLCRETDSRTDQAGSSQVVESLLSAAPRSAEDCLEQQQIAESLASYYSDPVFGAPNTMLHERYKALAEGLRAHYAELATQARLAEAELRKEAQVALSRMK